MKNSSRMLLVVEILDEEVLEAGVKGAAFGGIFDVGREMIISHTSGEITIVVLWFV